MVHYTNLLAGRQVNAFYSTPEAYADAKQAEGVAWSVKTDNFFTYAGNANSTVQATSPQGPALTFPPL